MKTVANVLKHDITGAIRTAHSCLSVLEPRLTFALVGVEDRGDTLEAIALLDIEIAMLEAGQEVDDLRRVKLAGALILVRDILEQHAWGTALTGNDQAETDGIVAAVEGFEAARREITAFCSDLALDIAYRD